ncbi:MAG: M24 family metallopeptidase [Candidatus Accumulibacter sp.]|jgi:Xaa-Pro aminopeptidase|nr:M24 family metallopeptidase [Accumulibacter sp.]
MNISQEFEVKTERLRNLLAQRSLDAIYLKRQDDFAWLSCGGRNYVGAGDLGNCGLLVSKDGLFAVTSTIEANRMMAEENIGELGFSMRAGVWHDASFEAKTIESLVPGGKVGYDFGQANNVAADVKDLRMDLTEAEIGKYRKIGSLAAQVMEHVTGGVKPGDSEFEIAARIIGEMEAQGLELVSCMVAADERIADYRHPLPTYKRVKGRVQTGGNFKLYGLIVCMTRYVNFEPVSKRLREQYRVTQLIDCTYMARSTPGATYQTPLLAGKKAYETHGYPDEFDKHHQGGPIGYAGRDFRVDHTVGGVIREHQAFCWNPSITGTKSEDTIIVTGKGVEILTAPDVFPKVSIEACGKKFVRPDILER